MLHFLLLRRPRSSLWRTARSTGLSLRWGCAPTKKAFWRRTRSLPPCRLHCPSLAASFVHLNTLAAVAHATIAWAHVCYCDKGTWRSGEVVSELEAAMELQPVSAGVVETAGLHRVSTRSTGLESAQSGDSSPGRAITSEVPSSPTHSRRSYWAVALLAVTTTFVFADQNLMVSFWWCRCCAALSASDRLTLSLSSLRRRT